MMLNLPDSLPVVVLSAFAASQGYYLEFSKLNEGVINMVDTKPNNEVDNILKHVNAHKGGK